jgi:hypothetical protein
MDAEKENSESTQPPKLDKQAAAFSYGLCGYVVLVCVAIIGIGVWSFYQTPQRLLTSDRISFALLAALATNFAFHCLGRILGPLLRERIAKISNRIFKSKVDPYEHWFTRLYTVLERF